MAQNGPTKRPKIGNLRAGSNQVRTVPQDAVIISFVDGAGEHASQSDRRSRQDQETNGAYRILVDSGNSSGQQASGGSGGFSESTDSATPLIESLHEAASEEHRSEKPIVAPGSTHSKGTKQQSNTTINGKNPNSTRKQPQSSLKSSNIATTDAPNKYQNHKTGGGGGSIMRSPAESLSQMTNNRRTSVSTGRPAPAPPNSVIEVAANSASNQHQYQHQNSNSSKSPTDSATVSRTNSPIPFSDYLISDPASLQRAATNKTTSTTTMGRHNRSPDDSNIFSHLLPKNGFEETPTANFGQQFIEPSSRGLISKVTNLMSGEAPMGVVMKMSKQDKHELAKQLLNSARHSDWALVDEILNFARVYGIYTDIVTDTNRWTPTMYAARDNRAIIVEKLIELGFDVNAQALNGVTALHLACAFAREETIRVLLSSNADPTIKGGAKEQMAIHILCLKMSPNAVAPLQLILKAAPVSIKLEGDAEGSIPLILAVEAANLEVISELLGSISKEQLAYRKPPDENSALHYAIKNQNLEILKLFIDRGVNLNLQNGKGQTGLHLATEMEAEPIVRLLCAAGADPDLIDKDHQTPIHIATARSYHKIVDILSEKFKASIMSRTKDGSTLMHLASNAYNSQAAMAFIRKGIPIHMPNKAGAKCIHMAAIRGHVEVVKAIVAKGENVDCRTKDGLTPLHLAVKFSQHEVVETLLGLGANLQLKTGKLGETPLHIATMVKDGEACVDLLIKSGADVDATEQKQETPMHFAARFNNLKAVQLLLEDGAKVDSQNIEGENVLHACVRESNLSIIELMIDHIIKNRTADEARLLINQQNKDGESSLHYTAKLDGKLSHQVDEDRQIMRLLLENGGDVFLETFLQRETPVHYCCKSGNTNVLAEIHAHLEPQECQVAYNKPAKNLWTPLFYAAYQGHPEIIRMLLNQSTRVDVFDENGEAPLHVAVERGKEEVVDILLHHDAFVNVRNKLGMTPLHLASKLGYNSIARQLVSDHGALLDAMTITKQTPLHLAAEAGQFEVCETLMRLRADLNAADNHGQTPLHLAAQKNHAEVLKYFLNDRSELLTIPNKMGYNCAHIAAMNGSISVIKELLRFNRDAVIAVRIKKTGSTTLHLASEGGHATIVKLLLSAGAKASDENAAGETALHLAAKHGHVKVLHTIKTAVDWKICSRRNGLTALHVAASSGQTEFVAEMLRYRVPGGLKSERSGVDPKSDYGVTPLHLASRNGHESVVRMLLNSAGVQVDAATEIEKYIPMHLAAQGGHEQVANLLISRSPESLIKPDGHGRTALHFAASHGHTRMAAMLLGQSAQMNAQDDRGWTPLHYAARHGYLDVVKLLVDSGADPTVCSKEGKIPLCNAANAGHKEVLSFLLKRDHDSIELMENKSFLIDLMQCSKSRLGGASMPMRELSSDISNNNQAPHSSSDSRRNLTLVEQQQQQSQSQQQQSQQQQSQQQQSGYLPIQEFILVSEAPIDTAVKLAKCYENLVEKEKDRSRDLEWAKDYCDQIATDLLSIIAKISNASAMLRARDYKNVEFLDVLLELGRKDVVSQHGVQKYLSSVWAGSLQWSGWKFILLFFAFLVCPPIWVIVSCPFGHKLAKIPVIKFMSYLASHIFFIVLLCITTVFAPLYVPLWEGVDLMPLPHEWLLAIWFLGNLVSNMSNPADRAGFGSIKLVVMGIGFASFVTHCIGFLFDDAESRVIILYLRNQMLAVVVLLSFIEFLNFLSFHHLFGPWAVIIQDLVKDMMRFLVILGIFMIGFSLSISAIYVPVFKPAEDQNGTLSSPGLEFQSPIFTFEMLFFSLFGLVEPDLMPPLHLSPSYSKVFMKLVFGIYMMITVVVLINLLIAMMSNTYQRIEARSDTEWKFGRAKLIRNMIRTSPTPSPLILFVGIWITLGKKLRERQIERRKREKMTVSAFNRKASVSTAASKAANIWLNKSARFSKGTISPSFGGHSQTSTLNAEALEGTKKLSEVCNWANIVRKYGEHYGYNQRNDDRDYEEEEEADRNNENNGQQDQQQQAPGAATRGAPTTNPITH